MVKPHYSNLRIITAMSWVSENLGVLRYVKMFPTITVEWRVKDGSMDHCLPSVYREMTKYYIREGRFEDGYKMTHALLNSVHSDEFVSYIHMDWCVSSLDKRVREELPKEFTLEYAIEL